MGESSEEGGENMRKVIVKVFLSDRDEFEAKMEDMELEFSPIVWQHDRIYLPRNYKRGMNYPRLIMRTEMKAVDGDPDYKVILKRHIEDSGIDVVDETRVLNYKEMVNIIHQLGFEKVDEVSRKRQEVRMDEDTMMYIDNIEGIEGFFAKFERNLDEDEKVNEARKELVKSFEALEETDFVEKTYFEIKK